jgi:transposase
MKRKRYDREFKLQTVQMILEEKKSVAQVSQELDISSNTLHRWVRQYRQDQDQAFPGHEKLKPADQGTGLKKAST